LKKEIEELKQENDNSPEYKSYLAKKENELKDKEKNVSLSLIGESSRFPQ